MKHSICVWIIILGCIPAIAAGQIAALAEPPGYKLLPGKVQLAGLVGGSYLGAGVAETQGTVGGEVLVGLPHNFAFFAEGTRHNSINLGVLDLRLGTDLYDFGGGVEWNIPNPSRIVPYFRAGVGLLHGRAEARFGRYRFGLSGSRFAGNFGGGVRIHLKERFGLLVDFRAFDGPDVPWMVKTSFGFFYRFQ